MKIVCMMVSFAETSSKVLLYSVGHLPLAPTSKELHAWADMCLDIAEAAERGTYREASCGEDVLDALNRLLSE